MAVDAVTEDDVGEAVELQEGIVSYEIDHRVLTDVIDDGYTWQGQFDEETRQSYEDNHRVEEGCPRVASEQVGAHHIFAMPYDVQYHDCRYQYP